jgi:hypothetical protein
MGEGTRFLWDGWYRKATLLRQPKAEAHSFAERVEIREGEPSECDTVCSRIKAFVVKSNSYFGRMSHMEKRDDWHDRLWEKLLKLARTRFDGTVTSAELQVLKNTVSPLDLPSPDDNAPRPEGPYDVNTPRPEVRAAFLSWLATEPEARPYIHAKGLRVYSSTITGDLDLGKHLQLPTLDFRRCTVMGRMTLEASETKGIQIIDCCLSTGLEADGVVVHGPVRLYRTQSDGEVRFINGIIESNLECQGAKLTTKDNYALTLDGATIKGDVFLTQNFECNGEIQNFECNGEIQMLGAKIDGSVHCTGARLSGKNYALSLDKARIGGNVLLNGTLQCSGTIYLPNSTIEGDLNFVGAELAAVICKNMTLSGDLVWRCVRKTSATRLSLNGARVRELRDDEASWPANGKLELSNLVYGDLVLYPDLTPKELEQGVRADEQDLTLEERKRVRWLKLQSPASRLRPQPWVQLAKHLELANNKAGAKHVLFELRRLQAQKSWRPWRDARIVFAWLEKVPALITYSILLTLALGTLTFAGADHSGAMIPTARDKDGQPLAGAALRHYPRFQSFIYTLENAVPLVKLGVDDKWAPDPANGGKAWFPKKPCLDWLGWFNSYDFLTWSRWGIIILGWFQAAVLGTALTSRFKS